MSAEEEGNDGPVGLVLAGGGARGAYELGALSVLLKELDGLDQRPTILVGNSVGALNVAYLAANAHRPVDEVIRDGTKRWKALTPTDLIRHVLAPGLMSRSLGYAGEFLRLPKSRIWSLLDTAPLTSTIEGIVNFDQLEANVDQGKLDAAAVVTSSVLTRRTVVFHRGGGSPPFDARRLIDYVATPLVLEHVRASAAIPAVFPSQHVCTPEEAKGWYIDGGVRLNTPIKPAIKLGARRVVVIALSSLSPGPTAIAGEDRPDALAGIGQLVQGLLADHLAQDVHTLARVNADVKAGAHTRREIPYIVVAPEQPSTVEELALDVFRRRYGRFRDLLRTRDLALIGRATGAGVEAQNAVLISLLLFDKEFIGSLITMGAEDARRWLGGSHDDGVWQIGPL